ncbi:recombinase family protein [Enterovibrio norvegicus]|uniref:recombinase family protein n=1 Tax=Enterovibrio norvegicus TaxID=188144 RepID=UPI0010BE71CE|nr:recombinase family protein [Enterovibrio norvegicus]TKF33085.1 resolvase [Enterovibrio norvegicus]
MFIRAYLRASTDEQNAERAKAALDQFTQEHGQRIASYYTENISGTQLDRPELNRLLTDTQESDILLVEQIDRLTRLNDHDWKQLKRMIEEKGIRIVSMDVPTSWQALDNNALTHNDPIIKAVLDAINNMLIELMAAMARKDYETRRERQRQGIETAKANGKYKGKRADAERHQKVKSFREKGLSLREIAEATSYSRSQVCRILAS